MLVSMTSWEKYTQEIYLKEINQIEYPFAVNMTNQMPLSKKRIAWVDWMKALAMYFIIAGHCWVPGNKYIYVFSVPCFFIISGYLSHKEERDKVFWGQRRSSVAGLTKIFD